MANIKIKPKDVVIPLDLKLVWQDPRITEALDKLEKALDKHKT